MTSQPSKDDEDNDKQASLSNQRPVRPELLRKMYYPDTLYPDSYTFFATTRSRSTDVAEPTSSTTNLATIPKHSTIDNEMIERQNKYSASMPLDAIIPTTFRKRTSSLFPSQSKKNLISKLTTNASLPILND